ncbi:MAG: hypothetical protein ACK40O_13650 [Allosphingosinicella sp.]
MSEPTTMMAMAGFALAGLAMLLFAGLSAWRGWLDLRRMELGGARGSGEAATAAAGAAGSMAELIELADLRERIRKLESIAACVDL